MLPLIVVVDVVVVFLQRRDAQLGVGQGGDVPVPARGAVFVLPAEFLHPSRDGISGPLNPLAAQTDAFSQRLLQAVFGAEDRRRNAVHAPGQRRAAAAVDRGVNAPRGSGRQALRIGGDERRAVVSGLGQPVGVDRRRGRRRSRCGQRRDLPVA